MLSFWRSAVTSAILLAGLMTPSVQAETQSFDGLIQIQLPSAQDHDIGLLLAMIESQDHALEQALSYLRPQPFFAGTRLQPEYYPALALSLVSDALAFEPASGSSEPPQVQYKIKLRYDNLRFPDKIDTFFQENFYLVALVKRSLDRNHQLQALGRSYFDKLSQARDPGYIQLLRQTEGAPLQQQFKIAQLAQQIQELYRREQYDKALTLTDEALKLDPADADLNMIRGLLNAQTKKYDLALADLSKAIAAAPQEATFYLLRGSTYLAQGILLDKSRQDFNRSIELKPDIGLAYLLRAYIYRAQKDCPAALADFKKACELGMSNACDKSCFAF